MENVKLCILFSKEDSLQNILRCSECNNYFKNEIYNYINDSEDNLCEKCAEPLTSNGTILTKNKQLMHIINDVKIACKFYKKPGGCLNILPYKELEDHHKICKYRTIICPFDKTCTWRSTISKLGQHIIDKHKESSIEKNRVQFERPLDNDFEIILQVIVSFRLFLLRMSYISSTNMIYYTIYTYAEKLEEPYTYSIKFTCNKTRNKYTLSHEVFTGLYENVFINEECFSVNAQKLNTVIDMSECLDVTFKVHQKESPGAILHLDLLKEFRDNLLDAMECTVCTLVMTGFIYQCEAGHSICSKCTTNICPTCRGKMGITATPARKNIRNYSLESLSRLEVPCVYYEFGCRIQLPLGSITEHENKCTFILADKKLYQET